MHRRAEPALGYNYNLVAVPFAAFGLCHRRWPASARRSSLGVVLNALRVCRTAAASPVLRACT